MYTPDQLKETDDFSKAEQVSLPRAIMNAKNNLERRIRTIAAVIQEEPKEVYQKIHQIILKAETELLCAFGDYEEELAIKTACLALQNLYNTEWIFKYSKLLNIASKAGARIAYASEENNFQLDFKDELMFEEHERKLKDIIIRAKAEIKRLENESEKIERIGKYIEQLEDLLIAIEVSISILSLADIKSKIQQRIDYAEDRHGLDFTTEEEQIDQCVKNALSEIHEKDDLVEKYKQVSAARDVLEEIDVKIEKEIALKEIYLKWEEVKETIQSFDDRKTCGISFSREGSFADSTLEDSREVIGSIHKPHSPIGLSQVSQLFVAASGALSSLEWNKSQIYLKYGIERIERAIKFKMLKMRYDGISEMKVQDFKRYTKKLLEEAEEEMVYGSVLKDPVQKAIREKCSRPSSIPFERVERIVERSILEIKNYQ